MDFKEYRSELKHKREVIQMYKEILNSQFDDENERFKMARILKEHENDLGHLHRKWLKRKLNLD